MSTDNSLPIVTGFLAGRWWALLLRGLIAVAFGVVAFAWPSVTIATLVLLFGFYALADGVFSLLTAIGGRSHPPEDRWLLAIEGLIGIWAGILILRAPEITAFVLVFFISIWAMATGFLRIAAALRLRKEISGEVLLVLSGLVSVLFGLMLLLRPALGVITLVWVIAGYALVMGVLMIMLSVELRGRRAV